MTPRTCSLCSKEKHFALNKYSSQVVKLLKARENVIEESLNRNGKILANLQDKRKVKEWKKQKLLSFKNLKKENAI